MINEFKRCPLCQRNYAEVEHHLIFGSSLRRLADEDGLTIFICNDCHTHGSISARIHDNSAAEALSKILGQLMFENNKLALGLTKEQARKEFMQRYGRSFL